MKLLTKGIGASPGRARGPITFSSESARPGSILVRIETSHEDTAAIRIAAAVVTTRGGITGDAAIIARTLKKPCIAACPEVHIDYTARTMRVGDQTFREGETLEIDGATGEIYSTRE
jgi:pyruvate,orthophosphate dikinase